MKREQEELARRRTEVIMKVRSGQISATDGARELGVSRKTYYEWEGRGLEAMMEALVNQPPGRPPDPVDPEKEQLREKVRELEKEVELVKARMEIRELMRNAESPGSPEKKK